MTSCDPFRPEPGASGGVEIECATAAVVLRPSGAVWLPDERALAVADLHLGKTERTARRGGPLLPPYENADTIERLAAEIAALDPRRVFSVGDAFDDLAAAAAMEPAALADLADLARGRDWLWIAGNHDPGRPAAASLPGEAVAEAVAGGVVLRHIARVSAPNAAQGEISGHYHPKAVICARGRRLSRRCFVSDARRLIAPAFGAYAGGLDIDDPAFDPLFPEGAAAHLLSGDRLVTSARRSVSTPGARAS